MSEPLDRLRTALADRYLIERQLGQGGMATVYLGHDLKHDRDVAIKVLHADLGAALGADRFLTEIKTTAKLQHPHILPLLDSGDADGLLYYVMPLASGETLRARLERERQLPIEDAVRIATEVADALHAAHVLGIVHRDIKPENILLQGGHALVADFGIALAVQQAGGQRMTQTGLSLGTPQYMSPEQAMGDRAVDARSDIYALGAVCYEMLVGQPPFTGATVQAIVARVMTERPASIQGVRDTVPPSLEGAILKALAKLPADRYPNAAAFGAAITAPPTATTPFRVEVTPSRRRPGLPVAALALGPAGRSGPGSRTGASLPAGSPVSPPTRDWKFSRPFPPTGRCWPTPQAIPCGSVSTSSPSAGAVRCHSPANRHRTPPSAGRLPSGENWSGVCRDRSRSLAGLPPGTASSSAPTGASIPSPSGWGAARPSPSSAAHRAPSPRPPGPPMAAGLLSYGAIP